MEIKQKRYSNRTGFAFGEDEFKYSIQNSSTFSVWFTDIGRDSQTLEECNHRPRNAGSTPERKTQELATNAT